MKTFFALLLLISTSLAQLPPLPPNVVSTNRPIYHAPPRLTRIIISSDPDTNAWNVWDCSTNPAGPWTFYTNTPVWQNSFEVASTNQMMFFRVHSVYLGPINN